MIRTQKTFLLGVLLCIVALCGCERTPNDTPKESLIPTEENTYTINGESYAFRSVVAMLTGEDLLIAATPTSGLVTFSEMADNGNYFYGAVSPLLVGKRFDVTTEPRLFTVVSLLAGAQIETLAPGMTEEVTEGEMLLSNSDGKVSIEAYFVIANDVRLGVNISIAQSISVNENEIGRNEELKPLRSAFYEVADDGTTTLWLTPAGIDFFDELSIASWYFRLEVSAEMIGEVRDVTSLPVGGEFAFEMTDNLVGDTFRIGSKDLQSATGYIWVECHGEGLYMVKLRIEVGDRLFVVQFAGECKSSSVVEETKTNYLTYNNTEIALQSAQIDVTEDVWVVELTAADQSVLSATIPEEFFTGDAKGFSQSPYLTVTYNGRTYSKANGDSGTIFASLTILDSPQEEPILNFEFVGYDNLSCAYSGKCPYKER